MNEAAHAVLLHGRSIGTLVQRGDVARFVFSDDYWTTSNRNVLGLWFEDNPRQSPQAALRLPSWFSNLLPEGRLREWIAHDRGVSADRELQLLLRIGTDLPGAVEVISDIGDRSHLSSLQAKALPPVEGVDADSPWKFSLAGVGLKFSLLRDGDRLTVPGRDALGNWIVKFPDSKFPRVPENEFGVMQLAAQVGIEVPNVDLVHRDELPDMPDIVWPNNESYAYAIERFDRSASGRVHIEDFAQIRGLYSDRKYAGSFETVAAHSFRARDYDSLRECVRRITFNLLIGNGDAHLKNWSLIYPNGRVPKLSPVYDLVCTGAYYPESSPDSVGLKFGGTRSFDRVTRSAFLHLQEKLHVSDADIMDVVDATIETFFAAWDDGPPGGLPPFVADWVRPHAESVRRRIGP